MAQLKPEKIKALTNSVLQQAKVFLEDADEFYPFGSVIDKNEAIKPISVYWGEEFPNSTEVLIKMEEVVSQGIRLHDYIAGAIATDVYIKTNTSSGIVKKVALELRLYQENFSVTNYFHYYKENNQYYFEPIIPLLQ